MNYHGSLQNCFEGPSAPDADGKEMVYRAMAEVAKNLEALIAVLMVKELSYAEWERTRTAREALNRFEATIASAPVTLAPIGAFKPWGQRFG